MDQAMHPLALLVVGLFAFFYGTLHLLTYVIADRLAGLEFQNGVVAWTTLIGLGGAVWDDIQEEVHHRWIHGLGDDGSGVALAKPRDIRSSSRFIVRNRRLDASACEAHTRLPASTDRPPRLLLVLRVP